MRSVEELLSRFRDILCSGWSPATHRDYTVSCTTGELVQMILSFTPPGELVPVCDDDIHGLMLGLGFSEGLVRFQKEPNSRAELRIAWLLKEKQFPREEDEDNE